MTSDIESQQPAKIDRLSKVESALGTDGPFRNIPIEVSVIVGKAKLTVSELVNLQADSVLSLDSKIDDPVEIYVGDRLIGLGELQEVSHGAAQVLAVRLTEIADQGGRR